MIMSPAGMIRRWCGGIRRAFGPVNLDDAERIREYAVELDNLPLAVTAGLTDLTRLKRF